MLVDHHGLKTVIRIDQVFGESDKKHPGDADCIGTGTIEGYTAIDYDYESSYKYYYIGLKVPAFDGYTFTAYFYDSGYSVFNFLEQNHIFELGQERYQTFTTYLANTAQHH